MTPLIHRALELWWAQAKPAGRAAQEAAACLAAVLDASAEFAKSAASGNAAFATAMISAKSFEGIVDIQHGYIRDSVRDAAAMASRLADAGAAVAKESNALARAAADGAGASGASTSA